ncbi:MAG: GNAT family N-acetyltransferase [Chitinophagales bacterium]
MNNHPQITIRKGSILEATTITHQIPEFGKAYMTAEYVKRLDSVTHLILIAEIEGEIVGFKVGYEREQDGSFYSWMGGVLPAHRRKGVASLLAGRQEQWALLKGYQSVRFKTHNQHQGMLLCSIKRGFKIVDFDARATVDENRIILEKHFRNV